MIIAGGPARKESREELSPAIAKVFGDTMPCQFVADLGPLFEREHPNLVIYESGNPGGVLAAKFATIPAAVYTLR